MALPYLSCMDLQFRHKGVSAPVSSPVAKEGVNIAGNRNGAPFVAGTQSGPRGVRGCEGMHGNGIRAEP